MLSGLTLPTRGRYEWRYAAYQFTNINEAPYGGDNEGVVSRKMLDENGALLGEWTYVQARHVGLNQTTTTVRTPLGDETVHYFYDWDIAWQHGLPFTTAVNDGGSPPRYLSRKVFDGTAASGTLLRTEHVRYTADTNIAPAPNPRLERSKIVYHDDSNRETTVTLSEFDGLGHYRRQVTASTIPDTNSRDVFTDFNPGQGRYEYDANLGTFSPGHGFSMLGDAQPWVLTTFPSRSITENAIQALSTFCFDSSSGSLMRSRVLKGTAPSNQDLVVNFSYWQGNVTREEYFGGDKETHSLSSSCSTGYPSSWTQYRIDHTYQHGSLKSSEYKTAGGGSMSFKHVDHDLDLSTGRVTTARDTAGLATTFSYSNMGRLTQVQPPGQVATTHTYFPADAFNLARVKHLTGTDVESWNHHDAFGRPWKERRVRENGQFSAREVLYNANGWKVSVSEWMPDGGALTSKTQFLNHDPFGRPGIVRPPDGSQHDVTFSYTGAAQIGRSVKIGTGRSGSAVVYTPAATTERYNGYGQLARVIEANGTETKYSYNLHGQLAKVEMDVTGTPQVREFNYDKRGLLTSERHPEKGVSGNGLVNFYDYDARGHVGRMNDGAHDLTPSYDRAERLLQIKETSGQQRVLKLFEYATANSGSDYRKGRLWKATRHNYLEPRLPGQTISVTETYVYGSQGRPSGRTTTLSSGESFSLAFAYDTLGHLQTLTYPACTHIQCTDDNPAPPRNQAYSYTRGYLTGITEFASSLSYNTNLTLGQVAHANGQVVTHQLDPNHIRRHYRIDFNAAGTQGVGPYSYDGAGNVAKIGAEDYLYDTLGRVTQGTTTGGAWQNYAYDKFGNLTNITTNGTPQPIAVSAATNRLAGFQYDGAGNQLHYIHGSANLTLAYDPFNMIHSVQGGTTDLIHVYTADDERILSFPATGTTSKWTLRGLENEVLRVYNESENGGSPIWTHDTDYIYQDRGVLASHSVAGGTRYFYLDHLGTPRLIKDGTGQVLAAHDYYAFGEELAPGLDQEPKKFTGHERDFNGSSVDDDLDYMHARYFAPEIGRFLQGDPSAVSYKIGIPQSWNRYSYVLNNPLLYTDPRGLYFFGGGFLDIAIAVAGSYGEETIVNGWAFPNMYSESWSWDFGDPAGYTEGFFDAFGPIAEFLLDFLLARYLPQSRAAAWLHMWQGMDDAARAARLAARVPTEKILKHMFKPQHALDWMIKLYGSQEAAYGALQGHMQALSDLGLLTLRGDGVWDDLVDFGGHRLRVQGWVDADGIFRLSDAWIPTVP
jgi:RHS repeat-associated protein